MAKLKPKHAFSKAVFSKFHGIPSESTPCAGGTEDLLNFRILPNGTLEKRYGWKSYRNYNNTVHAYWDGMLNETSYQFTVVGNIVYRSTGERSSKIVGGVTAGANCSFFQYKDDLYLLTGSSVLIYRPLTDQFEEAAPYAPLYGYQWNPSAGGSVNEVINLLTPRLRIHYLNTSENTSFLLPFFAKSIEKIRVDNRTVSEYSLNSVGDTLTIPSAASAATVEIAYTMNFELDVSASLRQSRIAYRSDDENGETLFLGGSPYGYRVFCSTHLDDISIAYCSVFYNQVDPLYFKAENLLLLGSTEFPVRAFCKQNGHVFAFSEQGVWLLQKDYKTDAMSHTAVLQNIGCNSSGAVISCENQIYLLSKSGFFLLQSNASNPENIQIKRIPLPRSDRVTQTWFDSALLFFEPWENEIWIYSPSSTSGTVLVYNRTISEWYFFDKIPSKHFFIKDSSVAFVNDDLLCVFSKLLYTDNGISITVSYRSHYFDFDSPETVKRAARVVICADLKDSSVDWKFESENAAHTFSVNGTTSACPKCFDRRFNIGRFRHMRYTLSSTGSTPISVYTVSFFVKS